MLLFSASDIFELLLKGDVIMNILNIKKHSTVAKIWIILCIVANIVIPQLSFELVENSQYVISLVFGALTATGYCILLAGKKTGYYIICVCAGITIIISIVFKYYAQAIFGIINPVITWFMIKAKWNVWAEIDSKKKQVLEQNHIDMKYSDYFWMRGKKYKTWSIVNTCILFPLVLPILAIMESDKAQRASTEAEHEMHMKRARLYNILTYCVCFAISITRGLLVEFGVISA